MGVHIMAKRLMLLDYDLTIMDNMIDFYEAFTESMKKYGYGTIGYDEFVQCVANDNLHSLIPPEKDSKDFWKYFRRIYPSKSGYPVKGIHRFLNILKSLQVPIVIISGREAHPLLLWLELARHGLDEYIDEIYTMFDLMIRGGTEEELFDKSWLIRHAVSKYGIEPRCAVYIGDYKQDYISSTKAGVRFIGITRFKERAESLRMLGADIIVSDYDELLCYFDKLFDDNC